MKKILSALSVCLLAAGVAQAAVVTWTGGGDGSSWSDADNWNTATGPVSGTDTVVIDGAYTVNYDVVAAQNFDDLDVLGGATLNMNTGAFTLNGAFNAVVGGVQGGSVINFFGGTHDFSTRLRVSSGDTIRVTGNDATIDMGQTALMAGATLDFIFDSDGVSSLDFESYVQGVTKPGTVTVDGAAYTGGSGEFTLINANGLMAAIDTVTVSGFDAADYTTVVTQDQTNDRVYLTVTRVLPAVITFNPDFDVSSDANTSATTNYAANGTDLDTGIVDDGTSTVDAETFYFADATTGIKFSYTLTITAFDGFLNPQPNSAGFGVGNPNKSETAASTGWLDTDSSDSEEEYLKFAITGLNVDFSGYIANSIAGVTTPILDSSAVGISGFDMTSYEAGTTDITLSDGINATYVGQPGDPFAIAGLGSLSEKTGEMTISVGNMGVETGDHRIRIAGMTTLVELNVIPAPTGSIFGIF